MFSDVQIVNMGLSKIASSRIKRLDPPESSLERFVDSNYLHWRRTEIAKRRWVFATIEGEALAQTAELTDVPRPYQYQLPVDCLRPVRHSKTEWVQRGRSILSAYENLKIDYISDVDETGFDPLFVEVLACRIAVECVEYVTQSNTKKADARQAYFDAVGDAAKANGFLIGPDNIADDDDDFPFVNARY